MKRLVVSSLAAAILAAMPRLSRADQLSSANFALTSENYGAAGATATVSASFQSFSDVGDAIGVSSEPAAIAWSGFTYTLFAGSTSLMLISGAPVGTALGVSSISWTWAAVSGATSYQIYQASSTSTMIGTVAAPPFVYTGLSTNTAYGIVVEGLDGGIVGSLSPSATAYTLAMPPTGFALASVYSSSVTLSWSADTNPPGTAYQVSYWQAAGSTTTATFTSIPGTLTGLTQGTTYTMTLAAVNGNGLTAPSGLVLSTATSVFPSAMQVVTSTGGTVVFQGQGGPVNVGIPPGAFGEATVTVTVDEPISFPCSGSAAGSLTPTNIGFEVSVTDSLEPTLGVTLAQSYQNVSLPPGINAGQLILARCDTTTNRWVPLPSTQDSIAMTVTAVSDHLSMFQIMGSIPSESVSSIQIACNPLRPNCSPMAFENLPADARLRIYTLTGALVKDLSADDTGAATWDGTNRGGGPVATGVYFIFAQGNGTTKTLKAAVER